MRERTKAGWRGVIAGLQLGDPPAAVARVATGLVVTVFLIIIVVIGMDIAGVMTPRRAPMMNLLMVVLGGSFMLAGLYATEVGPALSGRRRGTRPRTPVERVVFFAVGLACLAGGTFRMLR